MALCAAECLTAAPQQCSLTWGFVFVKRLTGGHGREKFDPDLQQITLELLVSATPGS